ncbi:4106_t:CDS:2 [Acaulospora morrowiae]|uniref:4106_t:CDS:1 n=1 Tax=Acaulospora morrowiae TaxID=94023 RepID=A0A9N9A5I5_9GLOM|nr:4106_t:CDS:2 [Acaulospora morrowiae]
MALVIETLDNTSWSPLSMQNTIVSIQVIKKHQQQIDVFIGCNDWSSQLLQRCFIVCLIRQISRVAMRSGGGAPVGLTGDPIPNFCFTNALCRRESNFSRCPCLPLMYHQFHAELIIFGQKWNILAKQSPEFMNYSVVSSFFGVLEMFICSTSLFEQKWREICGTMYCIRAIWLVANPCA